MCRFTTSLLSLQRVGQSTENYYSSIYRAGEHVVSKISGSRFGVSCDKLVLRYNTSPLTAQSTYFWRAELVRRVSHRCGDITPHYAKRAL